MKNIKILSTFLALFLCGITYANNLAINNVTATSTSVSFDISWENSWYVGHEPNNWDAVWVFIKGQDCASQYKTWDHVAVSTNSGNHSASGLLTVEPASDGMGVFIRRAALGAGNITPTSVTIGLQNAYNLSNVSFQVMGIEMVAVLDGAFQVGGMANSGNSFKTSTISSEAQINDSELYNGSSSDKSKNPTIPSNFPKGYNKFYIMKYEISQDQYAQFLNLLDYPKQVLRTQNTPASAVQTNALAGNNTNVEFRNGVKIQTTGDVANPAVYGTDLNNNGTFDESDDGRNTACNFLSWEDLLAYLDWTALRPMTELEYEKACRGLSPAIDGEYAWGNPFVVAASSNALNNAGENNETSTITPTLGIGIAAALDGSNNEDGPLRVGFAAKNNTGHIQSGSSYWGVMDMTGNVWEQTVSAGYDQGNISAFDGTLGDGEVDAFGDANANTWSLNAIHSVVRGGSWNVALDGSQLSYCTPSNGSANSSYYLRRFALSNLDNTSNHSVYSDHTNIAPAVLTPGQSYTADIYSGYNTTTYHNYAIWIDYNDNGTFESNERVVYQNYSSIGYSNHYSTPIITPSFTIPNILGVHRLRIQYNVGSSSSSYYGSSMDPCTNSYDSRSETEDYLVQIGNGSKSSVGARDFVGTDTYTNLRHNETGGRGVRQF